MLVPRVEEDCRLTASGNMTMVRCPGRSVCELPQRDSHNRDLHRAGIVSPHPRTDDQIRYLPPSTL
jgi:hypothetical protein